MSPSARGETNDSPEKDMNMLLGMSPRSKLEYLIKQQQQYSQKEKAEKAMKLHIEMKKRQETPGVGQYEVEKSRNLLEQQTPVFSISQSKKVLFNEKIAQENVSLPDIHKYEPLQSYKKAAIPYMNKEISLPYGAKKFRLY